MGGSQITANPKNKDEKKNGRCEGDEITPRQSRIQNRTQIMTIRKHGFNKKGREDFWPRKPQSEKSVATLPTHGLTRDRGYFSSKYGHTKYPAL